MIKLWSIKSSLLLVLFAISCKERFYPELSAAQSNYLVIEGYLNAQGISTITLGRTTPLGDTAKIKHELHAQVTIQGEDNSAFNVIETGDGIYTSDSIILNNNQKYRLHIKTTSGGEYLSAFTNVKITPPIDSVNWKHENDGVRIYVNTHDQNNNTRYYKWNYEETWEINSSFSNLVKYENGIISARDISEIHKLYVCWSSRNSTNILLGSSAQLSNDVINLAPITFISSESEETSIRYSILVRQYSLDRKAYDFYKMMKSNTESLGSVFDALPSDLTGNITCVSNPLERVIGYVTASTSTEKRIFISQAEFNSKYSNDCKSYYVVNNPDSIQFYFEFKVFSPYKQDGFPPAPVKGYYSSTPVCIDCTLRGSNIRPSFW